VSYTDELRKIEDAAYLISMVSVDEIIRFGFSCGLNERSRVLDLCCGYGTLLKIWHTAFGISGVGVDRCAEFIQKGGARLADAGGERIELVCADVLTYSDATQYDVVICSETFGTIQETLALGEKFLKPQGVLAYQKLYAKVPNPPQELVDFDEEVLPLNELNAIFNGLGYYVTHMASDTTSDWERYITWSARRDIARLRADPNDAQLKDWIDKWYRMYFEYRRPYEGQALFGLEKL
jgi:SAM-dependent methyltransferase